jgi:AI-2 transport protein TqsA
MARERKEQTYLTTVSLVILAFVALAVALAYTRTVMIPFVMALFIVSLVSPVQDFQVKRLRFPRIIAAVVTLLFALFIMGLVSLLVTYTIDTVVAAAPKYSESMAYVANLALKPLELIYQEEVAAEPPEPNAPDLNRSLVPQTESGQSQDIDVMHLMAKDIQPPTVIRPNPPDTLTPEAPLQLWVQDGNLVAVEDPNHTDYKTEAGKVRKLNTNQLVNDMRKHIVNISRNAVGIIVKMISGIFFVIIFVMFLVAGRDPYADHSEIYRTIVGKVRRYVGTKVIISLVTGILVWVSLTLLNLPLASVFGILAFLLNFIPSIGSIFSTLLPIPIAVATFQSHTPEGAIVVHWGSVLLAVAIPGAIQMTMGNVIEPKLMGEGLNLHPVTVLLALSFWGLLWGIVGMFLAAPITAAIRIVLMQFDTLRPIGRLLAGDFAKAGDA